VFLTPACRPPALPAHAFWFSSSHRLFVAGLGPRLLRLEKAQPFGVSAMRPPPLVRAMCAPASRDYSISRPSSVSCDGLVRLAPLQRADFSACFFCGPPSYSLPSRGGIKAISTLPTRFNLWQEPSSRSRFSHPPRIRNGCSAVRSRTTLKRSVRASV